MLNQPTLTITEWMDRRALSPGHLGKHLVRDIRVSNRNHLEWLLRSGLPRWDISPILLRAAHETLELRFSASLVRQLGLERALVHQIRREADIASSALGSMADRIVAIALQGVMNGELQSLLDDETAKLQRLIEYDPPRRSRCGKEMAR